MAEKPRKPAASKSDPLASYPQQLRHSTQNPGIVYVRASDMYALRGAAAGLREAPLITLAAEGGDSIRVYRGNPAPSARPPGARTAAAPTAAVLPVYSQTVGDGLAVPTGRVFVRFADAIKAESRADELKKLGYRIAQTLVYAPNAAWLEADDGAPAALRNIERVEKLEGVENVEPQFLSPRASR
jgi:hypothetical protein